MQKNNINTSLSAADYSIIPSFPKMPLVSICCITYNHAPFIRQCLDGFLMQEPPSCIASSLSAADHSIIPSLDTPWYEILIHDDCSTDGTTDIVREYAEKYPDVIKPLYEEENQYSKGDAGCMDDFNIKRAKGKYLAFCEGDDYWTDSLKLKKQVDFMEAHPECSATVHRYQKYYRTQDKYEKDLCNRFFVNNDLKYVELSLQDFYQSWVTQFLTLVCRRDCYDMAEMATYKHCCDSIQIYNLFLHGKVCLMSFVGGVYNISGEGTYTELSQTGKLRHSLSVYQEIAQHHQEDKLARQMCAKIMQDLLYRRGANSICERWNFAYAIWQNNHQYKQFLHNLVR